MRDTHLLKSRQTAKGILTHKGNPLADIDLFQALGHVGRIRLITTCTKDITEPSDPVILKACADERHRDLGEFLTIFKSTDADDKIPIVGIGNRNGRESVTHKGVGANVNEGLGGSVIPAEARVSKGVVVNALELGSLTDGNIRQLTATIEGKVGDLYNAVGEHDVRKILTAVERALIDTLEVVVLGKGHLLEIIAHGKGVVVYSHHAGGNMHFGDAIGVIERAVTKGQNIRIVKELDLGELAVLKGTEADNLNTLGYGQATRPSRRHSNQLAAVFGYQQTVHSLVVGIVLGNGIGREIMQADESVFTHVTHVLGDINRLQTRLIEYVGHDHHVCTATQSHGFQFLGLAEGVVVNEGYAVGDGHGGNMGIGKGLLRDLGHGESVRKGQRGDTAALEYRAPHGSHGCGNNHTTQLFGLFKGGLLDGLDLRVGGKGQGFDRRIRKGGTSDEGHACGDRNRLQFRVIERLGLDDLQGHRQLDTLHRAVHKRAAADVDDLSTQL